MGFFTGARIFVLKLLNIGNFLVRITDIRILYLKKIRKRTDGFNYQKKNMDGHGLKNGRPGPSLIRKAVRVSGRELGT